MSVEFLIYLSDICERINCGIALITTILIIGSGCLFIAYGTSDDREESRALRFLKFSKIFFIIGCICLILAVFIPSQKTVLLMSGSHIAKTSEVGEKVYRIIDNKLNELLKSQEKMHEENT
jgi:hypothetical protein